MVLILIAAAAAALLALWTVPKLQVRSARRGQTDNDISLADLLKAENDRRATLAQIIGGLAVLGTLYYSSQTAIYNSQTIRLQQSAQLTDRISKAVDQLGDKSPSIRLGGIHQLARLARDSEDERPAMLNILTSHIEEQERLARRRQTGDCDPFRRKPIDEIAQHDSQAVMDVLKGESSSSRKAGTFLQIDVANLRFVDASRTIFGRIELAGDDLTGSSFLDTHFAEGSQFLFSDFSFADLSGAEIPGANLQATCFAGANLDGTLLSGAQLDSADFRASQIRNTNFEGASLLHTDFRGVDLRTATGLKPEQMRLIVCNSETRFPDKPTLIAKDFEELAEHLKCNQNHSL